jgi:hypothetical protein
MAGSTSRTGGKSAAKAPSPSGLNLLKLSVGTQSVGNLIGWQHAHARRFEDGLPRHVTRMWPKRAEELLDGGSIYWVIKGQIQCRQKVLRLEAVTAEDGKDHCALVLDPKLIRTVSAPRRPFQGWRYLDAADAPADLPASRADEEPLPAHLAGALADLGLL